MMENNAYEYWNSDDEDIEQLRRDLELAIENDDGQIKILPSRASIKRQFVQLDESTMAEFQDALESLNEQFGLTSTRIRHLSQNEVDSLIEELLAVRKLNDILSSREDVLKKFSKDIISLDQIEPDRTAGSLVSTKNNLRISKEIRGGKLSVDVNLLKKRLTNEQFNSVTNSITTTVVTVAPDGKITQETTTNHEVNEKFLEAEMVKGNILSEDVFLSSVESKRTIAVALRGLDE